MKLGVDFNMYHMEDEDDEHDDNIVMQNSPAECRSQDVWGEDYFDVSNLRTSESFLFMLFYFRRTMIFIWIRNKNLNGLLSVTEFHFPQHLSQMLALQRLLSTFQVSQISILSMMQRSLSAPKKLLLQKQAISLMSPKTRLFYLKPTSKILMTLLAVALRMLSFFAAISI